MVFNVFIAVRTTMSLSLYLKTGVFIKKCYNSKRLKHGNVYNILHTHISFWVSSLTWPV